MKKSIKKITALLLISLTVIGMFPFINLQRVSAATALPVSVSNTDGRIVLEQKSGYEYCMDNKGWQDSNVFENLILGTKHSFYQREKGSSSVSGALVEEVYKPTAAKPKAPTVIRGEVSENRVVLDYVPGYEYRVDGGKWQKSNVFYGVIAGYTYRFYQRVAESATHLASPQSDGVFLTTPKRSSSTEYITYSASQGEAKLTGFYGDYPSDAAIILPTKLDGNVLTEIGFVSFSNDKYLKHLIMPETVKKIGERAFEQCHYLESINIPDSVTEIGEKAFWDCIKLKYLRLGDSVKTIKDNAFRFCEALEYVNLPVSLRTLGYGVFYGCESLKKIVVPNGLSRIEMHTFYNCSSLQYVEIPSGVTYIDDYETFKNCHSNLKLYVKSGSAAHNYARSEGIGYYTVTSGTPHEVTVSVKTGTKIVLVPFKGYEYRINGGDWQSSNVFDNLKLGTEYKFHQRMAATETAAAGPTSSYKWVDTRLKYIQTPPNIPTLNKKTSTTVTLNAISGGEYKMGDGNWQRSNVFTGLEADTEYEFYQRFAETDTHYASAAGRTLKVRTAGYLPGDVNGDAEVTLADVSALAQYVAEWQDIEVVEFALDTNGDGDIALSDVSHLAQYVAEWDGIVLY